MGRRQKDLGLKGDGVERKVIKEVDVAGEAYKRERNKRMKLSKSEKEKKTALIEAMRKHNVSNYRDDEAVPPIEITLSTTYNVKVTDVTDEVEETEEGEDDEKEEKPKAPKNEDKETH